MSVNLSAVQIVNPRFPEAHRRRRSARTGLDPELPHLEITESVMLREAEALTEMLQRLKSARRAARAG